MAVIINESKEVFKQRVCQLISGGYSGCSGLGSPSVFVSLDVLVVTDMPICLAGPVGVSYQPRYHSWTVMFGQYLILTFTRHLFIKVE